MDSLLASLQDALEGQIDFHGQRLTQLLSNVLLIISGVISFIVGFIYEDIHLTLWVGLGGTLLTALVVVPPWPFYNQNPATWLGSSGKISGGPQVMVDGIKVA
ncbi:microsomal signal peptidase subunit SPC12 [Penicillium chermesinum]|uniref:Signal peptidase complex subunit 1 n=1 Tax=Penicillium chermesinum TaxID=63820 RepID=A0A9W9NYL9_9EURO|nr:microsomal signal peptidase subunit SPC12 [Penicillium chermesinum]KAJ5232001.1 microsomal signal peptidase subunit SPC12 [Penicillium chermesinum]KAJ6171664.1 microsomal signal peptidase subunit SPC12 [Penicillium chermesinum]